MVKKNNENHILWQKPQVETATGGFSTHDFKAYGVSINTRTIEKGDMFIAITGEYFNGHDYVLEAKKKGAVCAIVSEKRDDYPENFPIVYVEDTYKALCDLAKFARYRFMGKVIAITGSIGKTSFKEFLTFILKMQGKVCSTDGNHNNLYGVPLSVARLGNWHKWAVFELGMSSKGEIKKLSEIVKPNVGIITQITNAHSEFFDSSNEIAEEKSEILQGMDSESIFLIYHDMPFYDFLVNKAKEKGVNRISSYGTIVNSKFRMIDFIFNAESTTSKVKSDIFGQRLEYNLPVVAEHYGVMSVGALGVASLVGLNIKKVMDYVDKFIIPDGRGNIFNLSINSKQVKIINDSYNASPLAMIESIKVLGKLKLDLGSRRIAILGDMLELKEPELEHLGLIPIIESANVDKVYTVGKYMKQVFEKLPKEKQGFATLNYEELIEKLEQEVKPNDILLFKGSKGSYVSKILDALSEKSVIK